MDWEQYDRAACGLLTTDQLGTITAVNQTLLDWIGGTREDLIGLRTFTDLLTGGGRIYHETHFAPMLAMQGSAREIAFDIYTVDGDRLPVLVNARRDHDDTGPVTQLAVFDATERRMYERELFIAKENAERSEDHARVLARTLQATLIPHAVPNVPGLDVAAVYLPAGAGHEIGGDFYDVFQVAADDWVVALGDVEGKGVDAAVVTAAVRYTIRAASVEHEPAGVLRVVNEVLRRDQSPRFCTALVLRCRRRHDRWTITIAAGGHPLPILAEVDHARPIGRPGTLLGFFDEVKFENVQVTLSESNLLVAYTDGVTEARRGRALLGVEAIGTTAVSALHERASVVLDRVIDQALDFGGRPNRDDIAAIAIRPVSYAESTD